jgi:hypothetical protein
VQFGYEGFARFTFLSMGFWVVMVAGIAFAMVFAVGPTRGKRAAKLWTDACVWLVVFGSAADFLWAWLSGEGRAFLALYGAAPLIEMAVMGLLFLGIMWFMAIRYTDGLKD